MTKSYVPSVRSVISDPSSRSLFNQLKRDFHIFSVIHLKGPFRRGGLAPEGSIDDPFEHPHSISEQNFPLTLHADKSDATAQHTASSSLFANTTSYERTRARRELFFGVQSTPDSHKLWCSFCPKSTCSSQSPSGPTTDHLCCGSGARGMRNNTRYTCAHVLICI